MRRDDDDEKRGRSMPLPPSDDEIRREQLGQATPYVAPRTELERQLAGIWRAALNMDLVGVDDNYNDLGGDSFLAAVIFSEIEATFAISIPMSTILRAPTIAQLASKVEALVEGREARA
jgi:acyl carrier protein